MASLFAVTLEVLLGVILEVTLADHQEDALEVISEAIPRAHLEVEVKGKE